VQHVPSSRRARARAGARRTLRQDGPAPKRRDSHRRRSVRPRIDPDPVGENHRRLSTNHADVPGTRHRGAAARVDRVREVAPRSAAGGVEIVMATVFVPARHYLNDGYGIRSWLLTRDHKRIALLYLAGVTVFFFLGGAM